MKDEKSSTDKTGRKVGGGKEKEKKEKRVSTGKGKLKNKINSRADDCSAKDDEENISILDSSDDNDHDNDIYFIHRTKLGRILSRHMRTVGRINCSL